MVIYGHEDVMGRGGALVESKPFVGVNPALAATWVPWASPYLACGALA